MYHQLRVCQLLIQSHLVARVGYCAASSQPIFTLAGKFASLTRRMLGGLKAAKLEDRIPHRRSPGSHTLSSQDKQ